MEEGLLVYTMGKFTVVFVTGFEEHVSTIVVKVIPSGTATHRCKNSGTRTIIYSMGKFTVLFDTGATHSFVSTF